jgi:hypothetical protein
MLLDLSSGVGIDTFTTYLASSLHPTSAQHIAEIFNIILASKYLFIIRVLEEGTSP